MLKETKAIMARRKIDKFIESCPYLTEEYKKELIEGYSDEKKLDDVVAGWIYEKIREDLQEWYSKAFNEWVSL